MALGWIPQAFLGDTPVVVPFVRERLRETVHGGCSGGVVSRLPGQLGLSGAGGLRAGVEHASDLSTWGVMKVRHVPRPPGCHWLLPGHGLPSLPCMWPGHTPETRETPGQGAADVFPKKLPACRGAVSAKSGQDTHCLPHGNNH